MDAVLTGVGADEHKAVAGALRSSAHEPLDPHQPDTHGVDERVLLVALVEVHLPAHRRDPYAVPVTADAGHDAVEMAAGRGQRTKPERVEQRDRPRTHRDDVADDAADPGGGALVWLDCGRMVVRLDLEHRSPTLPDLDRAGVLARALQHGFSTGREAPQQ